MSDQVAVYIVFGEFGCVAVSVAAWMVTTTRAGRDAKNLQELRRNAEEQARIAAVRSSREVIEPVTGPVLVQPQPDKER